MQLFSIPEAPKVEVRQHTPPPTALAENYHHGRLWSFASVPCEAAIRSELKANKEPPKTSPAAAMGSR